MNGVTRARGTSRVGLWWALSLAPAAMSLGTALLLQGGFIPNQVLIFRIRIDLGTLLLLAGLALSLVATLATTVWTVEVRRHARALTELRQAQAEAHRRFLRRLDHELKNPLTAIRVGLANLIEAPADEPPSHARASIKAQVARLAKLVADLRKLADLEIRPMERTSVDLEEVLTEAVGLAQETPERRERRVTFTLPQAPWPLPLVPGDRDLLLLAYYNVVENALKFSRADDAVEVRAFEDGRMVNVEVADTGPGIPAEDLPHIFEELYRGREARGVEGSGLGLALVRAIVERHGGMVTVRSRKGGGTAFTLRLPL